MANRIIIIIKINCNEDYNIFNTTHKININNNIIIAIAIINKRLMIIIYYIVYFNTRTLQIASIIYLN